MRSAAASLALVAAASAFHRQVGVERTYAASRLYGAAAAFSAANTSSYLRQVRPQVLRFEAVPRLLDLELGTISGPESLGLPARDRVHVPVAARHFKSLNTALQPFVLERLALVEAGRFEFPDLPRFTGH